MEEKHVIAHAIMLGFEPHRETDGVYRCKDLYLLVRDGTTTLFGQHINAGAYEGWIEKSYDDSIPALSNLAFNGKGKTVESE